MLVPRTMFNLHEVCDPAASRYALGGVYFERAPDGSPVAVATDGRRMVAATWTEDPFNNYPPLPGCDPSPNGGKFAAVIPRDACRKAPKLAEAAKKSPKPVLARNVVVDEHTFDPEKAHESQKVPIGATDLADAEVTLVRPMDGRFPRYQEVYPLPSSYTPTVSIEVDLHFLEDVCRTMRKTLGNPDGDYRGVVLSITDHESALYLTARTPGIEAAGVVMPLRNEKPPAPGWMPAVPKPVEEEADTEAKPNPEGEKIAGRLEKMADGMQKQIDRKRRPMMQNPTLKRLKEYNSRLHDADNLERTQRALRALASAHRDGSIPAELAKLRTKKAVAPLVYKGLRHDGGYYDVIPSDEYSNTSDQGKALQAFLDGSLSDDQRTADAERKAADELRRMEEELTRLKIDGFHPTPPNIVERMLSWAEIEPGMKVLEPSAGAGAIADAIREKQPEAELTLCEMVPRLIKILEAKGYGARTVAGEFIERFSTFDPKDGVGDVKPEMQQFDRVLMNPPFENLQDIDHVRHAFKLLKPGGRLVAIVSAGTKFRSDKKAVAFREWLENETEALEHGSAGRKVYDLEEDAFPNGIQARLIVVDKPWQVVSADDVFHPENPEPTPAPKPADEETPRAKAVGVVGYCKTSMLEEKGLRIVAADDPAQDEERDGETARVTAVGEICGAAVGQLEEAGLRVVWADDAATTAEGNQPKRSRTRKKRLLKELDDLRRECFTRGGQAWEGMAEEIRRVYALYSKVDWKDSKSMDNCEQCIRRFRERMGEAPKAAEPAKRTNRGKAKVVTGQHADGTFEVHPKDRIVISRSQSPAVLTFKMGGSAFFDAAGNPGKLTTIGPKLVALEGVAGGKHWLAVEKFVEFNRDNG